jgi:hypothetical protein
MVYTLGKITQLTYPVTETLALLHEVLGIPGRDLEQRLLMIDKAGVDAIVKEAAKELASADTKLLKARLDAIAEKSYSPRFNAQRAALAEVQP